VLKKQKKKKNPSNLIIMLRPRDQQNDQKRKRNNFWLLDFASLSRPNAKGNFLTTVPQWTSIL